jgi:AbrB family looped-hinge helix DNA binding protein
MLAARLTDTGQLVIPKPILDALRLGPGSELIVTIEGGRVVLEPRRLKSGKKLGDWLLLRTPHECRHHERDDCRLREPSG